VWTAATRCRIPSQLDGHVGDVGHPLCVRPVGVAPQSWEGWEVVQENPVIDGDGDRTQKPMA
jgi:hypothetical protein